MKKQSVYQMTLYLVVGVMTTVVNIVSYYSCTRWGNFPVMAATVTAWLLAVLFAFIGNKWLVFRSRNLTAGVITREFFAFVSCRLVTGIIDIVAMGIFVEMLGFPDVLMKVAANVMIIVGNFLASKYIVFREQADNFSGEESHVHG